MFSFKHKASLKDVIYKSMKNFQPNFAGNLF